MKGYAIARGTCRG